MLFFYYRCPKGSVYRKQKKQIFNFQEFSDIFSPDLNQKQVQYNQEKIEKMEKILKMRKMQKVKKMIQKSY